MRVERLCQLAGDHARQVLIGLQQPLMPSWVFVDGRARFHVIATPWKGESDKEQAIEQMGQLMRFHHAVAYSLVTEAWTAHAPEGWDPAQGSPIEARRLGGPDPQEVVIAFATEGKATQWRQWEIKRDWLERVIALEERAFNSEPVSWMTRLLE